MRERLARWVLVPLCVCTLWVRAQAGQNSLGVAYLSWSTSEHVSDLTQVPSGTMRLYLVLKSCPDIRELRVRLTWTPSTPDASGYLLVPGAPDSTEGGYATPSAADTTGATLDGLPFNSTIIFPEGSPRTRVAYAFDPVIAGVAPPANFCLLDVIAVDAQADTDHVAITGCAYIHGGAAPGCPASPWAIDGTAVTVVFPYATASPPPGALEGSIDDFDFSDPSVRDALRAAGITWLKKVFPDATPEDVHGTNFLGEPVLLPDASGAFIAPVSPTGGTPLEVAAALSGAAGIADVAAIPVYANLSVVPSDPLFRLQWGLHNVAQSGTFPCQTPLLADKDINGPEAWAYEQGVTSQVRVGILDTGIRDDHPGLGDRVELGPSFITLTANSRDDNGHGTSVSGVVAATGNDGIGSAGVAWGGRLVSAKVLDYRGYGESGSVAEGIEWTRTRPADSTIRIVNLSLGGVIADMPARLACGRAFLNGELLVAAAGNGNQSQVSYPAGYAKSVCAAGAVLGDGLRWDDIRTPQFWGQRCASANCGSNWGSPLDLAAPGGEYIATTRWRPGRDTLDYFALERCDTTGYFFGGTSAAAPVVTGVALLLASNRDSLTGEDLEEIMSRTAVHLGQGESVPSGVRDDSTGHGVVRADAALEYIRPERQLLHVCDSSLVVVQRDTGWVGLQNAPTQCPPVGYYYQAIRYRLRRRIAFDPPFASVPDVWVRSSGTTCMASAILSPTYTSSPYYSYDYADSLTGARVIPDSVTASGCTVEGYVYYFPNCSAPWFPRDTLHATIAITAVGDPAGPTAVRPEASPGFELSLAPNPLRGRGNIAFVLPRPGPVRLSVHDLMGRMVACPVRGYYPAGKHRIAWGARSAKGEPLPPGLYFLRLWHDGAVATRQAIVIGSGSGE
ncbi:MAG: S8 family serine peptidase [Candidatus Eisenbacteria bacterium]|nr:S8 family serine peptidase [Candidatus Eisenbacteria bacterium]